MSCQGGETNPNFYALFYSGFWSPMLAFQNDSRVIELIYVRPEWNNPITLRDLTLIYKMLEL